MGCGGSRALPVATGGPDGADVSARMLTPGDGGGGVPAAAAPPPPAGGGRAGDGGAGDGDGHGRGSMTGGGVKSPTKAGGAGDAAVAVALRSKRRGILVEGTSVQPDAAYVKKVVPKDAGERGLIASALSGNVLFSALGATGLEDMIDAMEPRTVPAGTTIITQGEAGDNFYVIEAGKVRRRRTEDGGRRTGERVMVGEGHTETTRAPGGPRPCRWQGRGSGALGARGSGPVAGH
jgi:hypothetical protein